MYCAIIRNDVLRSKGITFITLVLVAAAAMLVSLGGILVVNLAGAIDALMDRARTPHFQQMHLGEIDLGRLAAFARENADVEEFQVLEFLNFDGAQIILDGTSLADNFQDNGLTTQSEAFDYLLDLEGNVIDVADGQIYIPIMYMDDDAATVGGKAVIAGRQFEIAGFLRDSQMNSTLASSKRFLVSERDFAEMKGRGDMEYLIQFRLADISALSAFEEAYSSAGLEANGPTITYPLFRMINAISDGIMIAIILFISALVVAIAFMCIRFTLLAKVEEEYREIGVMKAIGLRVADIKKIYLAKYAVIAVLGCGLGFVAALLFRDVLLESIRLYMGESDNAVLALVAGAAGVVCVFLAIVAYVSTVLRRFRRISPAEAIRFGTSQEKSIGAKPIRLSRNKVFDTNVFLGVKDVLARSGLYGTMLGVLVILAFIIVVPQNLYNTISAESFIRYMGIGNADMRVDIQQTDDVSDRADEVASALASDSAVAAYVVLRTTTFRVQLDDDSQIAMHIELGDHSVFPVEYLDGGVPAADDEIALSIMYASELSKEVGDTITLLARGENKSLTVSGVYSDITNGGKTAKAAFTDTAADTLRSVIYAELAAGSPVGAKTSEYADRFGFAKVTGIDEYVAQTFGSTIDSVGTASRAAVLVALSVTLLVTLLFMKMLIAKDRYAVAVMKALGFTDLDIRIQYVSRSVFVLFVGVTLGTVLANTLGEALVGGAISSLGAASFRFVVNPLSAYVLSPLMMACTVFGATVIGTSGAGKVSISLNIKE